MTINPSQSIPDNQAMNDLSTTTQQHSEHRSWSANRYWLAQLFFWGSYCILNVSIIGLSATLSPVMAVIFIMLSVLLWLASDGLRWLHKNYGRSHSLTYIFLHLLWLLPLTGLAVQLLLSIIIYGLMSQLPNLSAGVQPINSGSFLLYTANTSIMLLLWSIIYLLRAEFFKRRHAEIEHWRLRAEMKERELDFLRSQINSHFLFNAINNLRAMVREDAERARSGLADLSTLLRGILHSDSRSLIKLQEELEWVRGYLSLEALQFENRLIVEEQIDPELLNAQMPPLLLQTLVENAIKHGIAARRSGGKIIFSARQLDNDRWQLSVTNPKSEFTPSHSGHGVGLKNARERLAHAFGDKAAITLETSSDEICARVVMPL